MFVGLSEVFCRRGVLRPASSRVHVFWFQFSCFGFVFLSPVTSAFSEGLGSIFVSGVRGGQTKSTLKSTMAGLSFGPDDSLSQSSLGPIKIFLNLDDVIRVVTDVQAIRSLCKNRARRVCHSVLISGGSL